MAEPLNDRKSRFQLIAKETCYQVRLLYRTVLFVYAPLVAVMTLLHFPYDTDLSQRMGPASPRARDFYEAAYRGGGGSKPGVNYEAAAKAANQAAQTAEVVRGFVSAYGLEAKRVLEVGSGSGGLQGIVADYTGLDLSSSAARHYYKPFVVGSATDLPFPDNSYDAIWTIWVLEHVPTPEKALSEMRRVLRPGGVLFLAVAWNCSPWAADGFNVRPYSDYNWRGKLVKASLPVRRMRWFRWLYRPSTRLIRWAHYSLAGRDTRLRFRALEPNYDIYWEPDSDATVSLDSFETYLWFRSQGDECLNCGKPREEWLRLQNPLILRIHK